MSKVLERHLYAWGRKAWDRLPRWLRQSAIPLAQAGFRAKHTALSWGRAGSRLSPVFVAATMRSGSNLLVDLLDAHPDVQMLGEGLNPRTRYGPPNLRGDSSRALAHLEWLFRRCPRVHPGAKLLADQLVLHRLTLADVVQEFPDARWIVLYRRSLTHQLVSLKRAQRSGDFVAPSNGDAVESATVALSEEELRQFYRETRESYAAMLRDLEPCRPLVLEYESLARDPQQIFDERIWPFLGLPRASVGSRLRRQSSGRLETSVQDFERLRSVVESPEAQLDLSHPHLPD
jgi:LPS sulfotransferase NodH